ncbi:hypothetical protein Anapl_09632 [Anas platyrhynchos]|uniref:Uncharacterized protein n=1 Tax=Anas platyrhynchos TaxID=8839 RepID=R0JKC8_ANAPL|nr:hypothetical protein Anapl_09632 [Anas platyrhynchos]
MKTRDSKAMQNQKDVLKLWTHATESLTNCQNVELPLSVFSNTRSTEFSFYELKTKRCAQRLSPARQALSPHDSAGGCQHHEKFSICVSLASFSRRGD